MKGVWLPHAMYYDVLWPPDPTGPDGNTKYMCIPKKTYSGRLFIIQYACAVTGHWAHQFHLMISLLLPTLDDCKEQFARDVPDRTASVVFGIEVCN